MFGTIILFICAVLGLLTAIFTHHAVRLFLSWLWALLEAFPPKDAYGRPGRLDYQAFRNTGFYKFFFYGYRITGSVVFIACMVLIGFALFG